MRITVRKKLLAGFIFVLLLFVATSVMAIVKMNGMGSKATDIMNNWMPSVTVLGHLNGDVSDAERLLLKLSLEPDASKLDQIQADLNKTLTAVQDDRKKYEPLISSPEEKKMYDTFAQNYDEWVTKLPPIIKAAYANNFDLANKLDTDASVQWDAAHQQVSQLILLNQQGSDQTTADSVQLFVSGRMFVIVMSAVAIVLAMLIAWIISQMIAKPVILMKGVAERIADGDLTADEIRVRNRDEIGELAAVFNKMAAQLRELIRNVSYSAEQVAASAEELTASAEQSAQSSEHIASTIQEVAAGSDEQVRSIETTVRSIHEMSAGVQQIAGNAEMVSSTAVETSDAAADGVRAIQTATEQMTSINSTVHGLSQAVKGLEERSHEIGQIVEVITGIASQTNLLALNAAIEAARAGEQGRGFAVVADEVRKLAEQSASSAQQIAELIHAIANETNQTAQTMEAATREVETGLAVVHTAGEAFERIMQSVTEVADQIREVSAASQQLSVGTNVVVDSIQTIADVAEQTASGTQNVSAATQEQLASMEEINASANGLSRMAEELHDLIRNFKV